MKFTESDYMNGLGSSEVKASEELPQTAPESFTVSAQGFDTAERATQSAQLVGVYIRELSRHIDLCRLDGVTFAYDYKQALLDLDRGYVTSHRLTPSDEYAIGVAMTPSVIRDGIVKSHIVLHAGLAMALEDPECENYSLAFHTLAHECAHVEITHRFDTVFPNVLLQRVFNNAHDSFKSQISLACWDEYAATMISAPFGHDPTAGYEETFILLLNKTLPKANELIKAYRIHSDVGRVMAEVYGAYGDLMKVACYHLGNMAGRDISLKDLPRTMASLDGHCQSAHSLLRYDRGYHGRAQAGPCRTCIFRS